MRGFNVTSELFSGTLASQIDNRPFSQPRAMRYLFSEREHMSTAVTGTPSKGENSNKQSQPGPSEVELSFQSLQAPSLDTVAIWSSRYQQQSQTMRLWAFLTVNKGNALIFSPDISIEKKQTLRSLPELARRLVIQNKYIIGSVKEFYLLLGLNRRHATVLSCPGRLAAGR